MLLGCLHHSLVRIRFSMRTYDTIFFHDSSDSLEIPDDLKLSFQCHLDGARSFVTLFKIEGLADVNSDFLVSLLFLIAPVDG